MKYIRTKDGIYEPTKWQCDLSGEMILVKADNKFGNDKVFTRDIIAQADTIEELMRVGDLVFKESGDIFVIQNQAQIDFYIKYKIVNKLFIEDSNGNYIKVAQKETIEGELELL